MITSSFHGVRCKHCNCMVAMLLRVIRLTNNSISIREGTAYFCDNCYTGFTLAEVEEMVTATSHQQNYDRAMSIIKS